MISTVCPSGVVVVHAAPDADAGAASGFVNVAHQIGGSLGLGILVTVFAATRSGTHNAQELLPS